MAARVRVHTGSALPSSTPWRWHLAGTAQDVLALGALAAVLLLAIALGMSPAIGRRIFAAVTVLLVILYVVKSEAVVLFGATLHVQDFTAGPVGTTFVRSLRGYSGFLLAASIVVGLAIVWLASRASGRWPRLTLSARGFAVAAVAAAAVLFLPIDVHRRETANSPVTTLARIAGEWRQREARESASFLPRGPVDLAAVREMAPAGRRFLSDDYPLMHSAPTASAIDAGVKPNIVFVAVEGLRAFEVGAYGGPIAGLTPHIDRLAREGIRIDRAYSASTYTPAGELALWYGVLPIPEDVLFVAAPATPLTGLPEILRSHGWRSMFWISSTDATFYERDRFYGPRGFQMFDGNSFPKSDPRVNWGISDRALARRAVEAMNRLPEPFAAMVLTVDNHHPYQLPSDAGPPIRNLPAPRHGYGEIGIGQFFGLHTSQMLQTIHYSDQAVGDFFAYAARQPWFERTIFVVCGDHGNAVAPPGKALTTAHQLAELRHHIPLIIYSPLIARRGVIAGPASQIDIMPTLLSLLNIPVRPGLGVDLLDPGVDRDRPIFAWSRHERMLTIVQGSLTYHCSLTEPGQPPAEEVLVDVERDPDGAVNLAGSRPEELRRFRRLTSLYAKEYSALILSGRSGMQIGR